MAEEIYINVANGETRVAVVEQGLLQEVFIERTARRGTVGNIYKGKVVRVLPGMQSAFVDVGEERAAFMHVTDLMHGHEAPDREPDREPDGEKQPARPCITELLHDGKELLVQATKEPIGTKGARVTANLSLASRYLVYFPGSSHCGVSQRIEDEAERARLLETLSSLGHGGGFIVRTAAENAGHEEIARDADRLRAKWQGLDAMAKAATSPALIHENLPLALRVMRDIINVRTTRILTDCGATHNAMSSFLDDYVPEKKNCLELAQGEGALFDRHQLEEQIEAALDRKVPLKSGGYLVIDQTEAMTTIDVNTGTFVGKRNLEETAYQTNLEAAAAIPRQLRLRNIGGIVIIDFIDMVDAEHQRQVLRALEKGQQSDRMKCNITQISELGLVEMTRKRTHGSLLRTICEPCGVCDGRGFLKTAESVCLDIFRQIRKSAGEMRGKECLVMASQPVVDRLVDEDADDVRALGSLVGASIACQVEPGYTREQYDIVVSAAASTQAR